MSDTRPAPPPLRLLERPVRRAPQRPAAPGLAWWQRWLARRIGVR